MARPTRKPSGRTRKPTTAKPSRRASAETPRHPEKSPSDPETRRQLERVRALCLALPGATEKVAWGAPTFRAPKVFAMFDDHHHGADRVALWVPAEKGVQGALVGTEPERFFRPPYVGPSGWIGIVLTAIGDDRLASLVEDGWRLVAPKRHVAELDARPVTRRGR